MHVLKKRLWDELEAIEMKEKAKTGEGRSLSMEHLSEIYMIAKAYVYLCKATKCHEEHEDKMKGEPMVEHEKQVMPEEQEVKPKIFG